MPSEPKLSSTLVLVSEYVKIHSFCSGQTRVNLLLMHSCCFLKALYEPSEGQNLSVAAALHLKAHRQLAERRHGNGLGHLGDSAVVTEDLHLLVPQCYGN